MWNELLFSYEINQVKVQVFHCDFSEKSSLIHKSFYNGAVQAIAEYLYYPYEIIAPRVCLFSITFRYDKTKLNETKEEDIEEYTKKALLDYMEESTDYASMILPKYVTAPNLEKNNITFWCDRLKRKAEEIEITLRLSETKTNGLKWATFCYESGTFYGRYRENGSNVLLISLPGYKSEWNDLSAYMDGEYEILQLSPLGYNTPNGFDQSKRVKGTWPVLYDTVSEISENCGYNRWFLEVCLAIKAIKKANQSLIFLGTSQGGGASLILSSIFNECTIACASEMPFLIGLSDFNYSRIRGFVANQINNPQKMIYDFYAKERLFVIDPVMHRERIKCSTLLVAGELDQECLSEDIYYLYQMLDCKKRYIELKNQGHGYTKEFMEFAKQWINEVM